MTGAINDEILSLTSNQNEVGDAAERILAEHHGIEAAKDITYGSVRKRLYSNCNLI